MFPWNPSKGGHLAVCDTAQAETCASVCMSWKGFDSVVASNVAAAVCRDKTSGLQQWVVFQSHTYNMQTVPKQNKSSVGLKHAAKFRSSI